MANLDRLRVEWNGSPVVGGGLSTFYAAAGGGAALQAAMVTFINAVKVNFTNQLSWTVPAGGEVIDAGTGAAVGAWAGGTATTIIANGTSQPHAAGVGFRIVWDTASFSRGRRVKGTTFMVPLLSAFYENDGSISGTLISQVNTACAALILAGHPVVWSRPTAPGASNGGFATVVTGQVPDKVSWLRSRRT